MHHGLRIRRHRRPADPHLDIWAIVSIVQSGNSAGTTVLWILLFLLLPILGLIIWALAGPKSKTV